MHSDLLATVRCPLDPTRSTSLHRDADQLVCDQCAASFPIKQGIPALVADEVTLPGELHEVSQLPCQRRHNRR